jgi:hypothetical protein
MRNGFPGASQVSQGGIYTFLFGGGNTHYVGYTIASSGERRSAAERAADNAWWATPWQTVTSKQNSGQSFYRLGEAEMRACQYVHWDGPNQNNCPAEWLGTNDGCDCGCQTQDADCVADSAFKPIIYSFYNYMNVSGRPYAEQTIEHGSQCASLIADQFRQANGDYIAPHTYSHAQTVNAGNALYNAVYSQCKSGLGDWGNIGAAVTCAFPYFDLDICDDAARQVRNCFVDPSKCNSSSDSPWNNVKNNANARARSISPDRLLGTHGHFPAGSAHAGPWSGNAEATVQWSSAGNVYGCWF